MDPSSIPRGSPGRLKRSQFNHRAERPDDPRWVLYHNNFSDSRALFDRRLVDPDALFARVERGEPLTDVERGYVEGLVAEGFFVDADVDEGAGYARWYAERVVARVDVARLTVVTTMRCDLACYYCFEDGMKGHGRMRPETVAALTSWVRRELLPRARPEALDLVLFGGEATLHPELCLELLDEVRAVALAAGVRFSAGMVTHGMRLTPDLARELVARGLRWVKITFDGDASGHDGLRVTHAGEGTFDKIWAATEAACAACPELKVVIGGNFDERNVATFPALVARLAASRFAAQIEVVRFKPIMQTIPPERLLRRGGKVAGAYEGVAFDARGVDAMLRLDAEAHAAGLPISARPDVGPCELHERHSLTVGPDGTIYECPAFVGHAQLAVGSVRDGVDARGEQQVAMAKFDDDCMRCDQLPSCAGGCHYASFQRTGSIAPKTCDHEYLSRATQAFLRRELDRMVVEALAEEAAAEQRVEEGDRR